MAALHSELHFLKVATVQGTDLWRTWTLAYAKLAVQGRVVTVERGDDAAYAAVKCVQHPF
jgi:hypothetical protein